MLITRSAGLGDDNDAVTATCRRLARSNAKNQTVADSCHCQVFLLVVFMCPAQYLRNAATGRRMPSLGVSSLDLGRFRAASFFLRDRLFRTILSSRTRPLRALVSTVGRFGA